MPTQDFGVKQWVELFEKIGLERKDMNAWHREFERRYPEAHADFLNWLGLPSERIADIRQQSSA